MVVLEPCPKYNMVAYLEKTDGNAEIGGKEVLEETVNAKGVYYMDTENAQDVGRTRNVVYEEEESAEDVVSTDKEKVSTDRSKVSTDKKEVSIDRPDEGTDAQTKGRYDPQTPPTTTTPSIFGDDETIAQVLIIMSQNKEKLKEKEKGVELKDVEETERPRPTSTRSLLTLKPLPKIDPKDKGKKKIEEEDESDTESEAEEEVKKLAEEEAIKAALSNEYDFIQARIEADRLLALRLQDEEREQFTMEERAKFLHDTIAAQRRFLAEQRAIEIRNRPPTRTQLRIQIMTYLKHKVKRFDESFTAVGSTEDERKIKEMNEGAKDLEQKRLKKKVAKETPKKEDTTKMLARKRKRPQPDVDSDDEHRKCLKIVTFEGTIDSEIMKRKSIIARLNKVSSPDGDYLVIYKANGNFRAFNYLMEVLHIFDRQDLFHLYELVMKQYSEVTMEGIELILWGDLKIMMESSKEENDQKLEDGTVIHMLVERRYPLSKDLMQRMLDFGLEVEIESTVALDLIRFIKQQLNEEVFNSPCFMVKSWLVQDQTVLGKDYSNLLIADSLLKTIWFINAPCYGNEALASPKANELTIPEQTATGKGKSNPFMAGSLPKTTKPT
ncbi:hypothetical protein Tco_0017012 [Tanacetum coccineum]